MPEGADELIVTPAQLGIVTFRYVPEGADPEDVDRIQQTLVDILASEGYAFLTSPVLGGKEVLRSPVPADKIARIYAGMSQDGLRFEMGDQPVIGPGPDEADKDGAEDPTVMVEGGELHVYYTGWNEAELNAQLMRATGSDVHHLRKDGVALPSTSTVTPRGRRSPASRTAPGVSSSSIPRTATLWWAWLPAPPWMGPGVSSRRSSIREMVTGTPGI